VIIETLRADRASRQVMPTLHAVAQEGLWFERAISPASWTLPAVGSLLTGMPPSAHGVVDAERRLTGETLAGRLQDAGYDTAFFGVNPYFMTDRGLRRGFATWQAWPGLSGGRLTSEVEVFLTERRSTAPLLLVIHYFEPHCRYRPPRGLHERYWPPAVPTGRQITRAQYDGMGDCFKLQRDGAPALDLDYYLAQYDAELTAVDTQLRRLQGVLERAGLGSGALLAVVGDHGEAFWEHGDFGHGRDLHVEQVGVPLVIRPPGGSPPRRIAAAVSTADLAATFLTFAGQEPTAGGDLLGWRGEPPEPAPVFSETQAGGRLLRALRQGGETTLWDTTTDGFSRFSRSEDPGELWPLDASIDARTRLKEHHAAVGAAARSAPLMGTPDPMAEQLRALGYQGGPMHPAARGEP